MIMVKYSWKMGWSIPVKLLFGLKKLMIDYCVKEHFTFFFDYVGNSKFYGSIFNKEGLEILKSEQQKLRSNNMVNLTEPEVYMISDSNSDEGNKTLFHMK